MPLPIELVLVRHGESESNRARELDHQGDSSLMSPKHLNRHTSAYRLTDKGISQAKAAGAWIRKNIPYYFDIYLVSDYARAQETAAYLELPAAEWEIDPYLVERDSGELDRLPKEKSEKLFGKSLEARALQEFYWRLPNGESRLDAGLRWDRVMQFLGQRHPESRVIVVAHGTLIETALVRRLHWTVEEFCRWKEGDDLAPRVNNCQVIHFTRRDPEPGKVNPSIRWWKSVCPWDEKLGHTEWHPITKKLFSNDELLERVSHFPRHID